MTTERLTDEQMIADWRRRRLTPEQRDTLERVVPGPRVRPGNTPRTPKELPEAERVNPFIGIAQMRQEPSRGIMSDIGHAAEIALGAVQQAVNPLGAGLAVASRLATNPQNTAQRARLAVEGINLFRERYGRNPSFQEQLAIVKDAQTLPTGVLGLMELAATSILPIGKKPDKLLGAFLEEPLKAPPRPTLALPSGITRIKPEPGAARDFNDSLDAAIRARYRGKAIPLPSGGDILGGDPSTARILLKRRVGSPEIGQPIRHSIKVPPPAPKPPLRFNMVIEDGTTVSMRGPDTPEMRRFIEQYKDRITVTSEQAGKKGVVGPTTPPAPEPISPVPASEQPLTMQDRIDILEETAGYIGAGKVAARGVIIRPNPRSYPWARHFNNEQLSALARHEGLDPTQHDWYDGIDSVVVNEFIKEPPSTPSQLGRIGKTAGDLRRQAKSLRAEARAQGKKPSELADPESAGGPITPSMQRTIEEMRPPTSGNLYAVPYENPARAAPSRPPQQIGQIQSGMNIGERPQQGQLLGETPGGITPQPNAVQDFIVQQQAARARQAQIAAGQQQLTDIQRDLPPVAGGVGPPIGNPPPVTRSTPLTLTQMRKQARGQRAFTPQQRAAMSNAAEPTPPDSFRYQEFDEPFNRLAAPIIKSAPNFGRVPGLRTAARLIGGGTRTAEGPIEQLGIAKALFEENQKNVNHIFVSAWRGTSYDVLGLKGEFGQSLRRNLPGGSKLPFIARNVKAAPGAPTGKRFFGTVPSIIEHPEWYVLTPEQEAALKPARDAFANIVRQEQDAGVDVVELQTNYWARMVKNGDKPTVQQALYDFFQTRRGVSTGKGHTKQRVFEFVDDIPEKFELVTDPAQSLAARLDAGVAVIANKIATTRIQALPGVETTEQFVGRTRPGLVADLKTAEADYSLALRREKASGLPVDTMLREQAYADVLDKQAALNAQSRKARESINLVGRIAPPELKAEVERYVTLPKPSPGSNGFEYAAQVFDLARQVETTGDLSFLRLQGGLLSFSHPIKFIKAASHALVAIIEEPNIYSANSYDLLAEGARNGAIVPPTEFLYARNGLTSLPGRIPLLGSALRGFNRGFEWFVYVGQAELYRGARGAGNKSVDELVGMSSAIRKSMGSESNAILGIRPTQANIERMAFFAPRFLRANFGLLLQSFGKGPGSNEARKAVGAMITGATALTIGVNYATTGKMPIVDDPFDPAWMKAKVGSSYVNFYGPFYPFFRLMARMAVRVEEKKPLAASMELSRFFESKASIGYQSIRTAMEVMLYPEHETRDSEGRVINPSAQGVWNFLQSKVPIGIAQAGQALGQGRPEGALQYVGEGVYDSPFALLDVKFREAKDINPQSKSIADAEEWQRTEMERRQPDLAKEGLNAARGLGGRARRTRADIDAEAQAHLETVAANKRLSSRTLINEYFNTESKAYSEKQGIDKALGITYSATEDPLRSLLDDWYALYDEALVNGVYNGDKLAGLRTAFLSRLTPDQREYILRNTNVGAEDIPKRMYNALPYKTKLQLQRSVGARKRATQTPQGVGR